MEFVEAGDVAGLSAWLSSNEPATGMVSLAAKRGDTAMIEILIAKGADIEEESPEYFGFRPLMLACGSSPECAPADTVRMLLRLGADPNARTDDGETAVMLAAQEGKPDILEVLAPVCELDAVNGDGETAVHIAIQSNKASSLRCHRVPERPKWCAGCRCRAYCSEECQK